MAESAQGPQKTPRREAEARQDRRRRGDDPAEPEWVLERIQQSFDNRRT